MEQLKCKICGGLLEQVENTRVFECQSCGTRQTLPLFSDESAILLYESGNKYLADAEYDKAENVFNQLLSINNADPEIYWNLVLCKYGVSYVLDPRTNKYIPTCNRTHYDSIFNDANYQNALKYSNDDTAAFYKEIASVINTIQKGIVEVSKKEKPFDIFISYKESIDGIRTKDSIKAQELYEKLTNLGYKVFFSRITLEKHIGQEYEPYIYAALQSSKVMLTICSSKENVESPWVKNEWSRFLSLRQKDNSKMLIPLYFDMEKSELPMEFSILPSQNINDKDFESELLRGIRKLIPVPISKAEKRRKTKKIVLTTIIVLFVLCLIGFGISIPKIMEYNENNNVYKQGVIQFENGEYDAAIETFESISGFEKADEKKSEALQIKYDAAKQLFYDGKYLDAIRALDEINGFSDVDNTIKEVKLKWRESLATIAIDNMSGSSSSYGAYYINPNGDVSAFNYNPGTNTKNVSIGEHGKIVSIADSYENIYALCEDGYVINSKENNKLETDWEDIIQITPVFNCTNAALKSDGSVVFGNTQLTTDTDEWLEETSNWKDIEALYYYVSRFGDGSVLCAIVVGVDNKGDPHVVSTLKTDFEDEYEKQAELIYYLQTLSNVESIDFDNDYNAIIRFNDGTYRVVFNEEEKELTEPNIKQYYLDDYGYLFSDTYKNSMVVLGSDNNATLYDNAKVLLKDVVCLNNGFAVTRTGKLYKIDYFDNEFLTAKETEGKTEIKIIWTGE